MPVDQLLDAAIEENVHLAVTTLQAVPTLAPLIDANQLKIVGAHYHLHSGQVSLQNA